MCEDDIYTRIWCLVGFGAGREWKSIVPTIEDKVPKLLKIAVTATNCVHCEEGLWKVDPAAHSEWSVTVSIC